MAKWVKFNKVFNYRPVGVKTWNIRYPAGMTIFLPEHAAEQAVAKGYGELVPRPAVVATGTGPASRVGVDRPEPDGQPAAVSAPLN